MTPKTLDDYFAEGMQAREGGRHERDNPYCAGSDERREWQAGFRASVEHESDDTELGLADNDGLTRSDQDCD